MRIFETPSTAEETLRDSLRIFHFLYGHPANPWVGGGGAVRARELYGRIASRHNVTVVSGRFPGAEDYAEDGIRYTFVGTAKDSYPLSILSYVFRARSFLRDKGEAADIVVEDFGPFNPIFSYRLRRDSVLQLHRKEGVRILRKYLLLGVPFYLAEKFYPGAFRNVTVVSEEGRLKFGLGARARVIPNGFDERYLSEEVKDERYMLFIGKLDMEQKGLDVLFDALKRLRGVHLKIAGKGKDEKRVRRLASGEGRNRVEVLGYVAGKEKLNALRNCTALVLPSRSEGSPLAALEAAALAKPIVASDIPELRYAVDAGFGASFRSGDAKDLAEKMKHMAEDAPLRAEMGAKARQYAKDFTWESIAQRYERFLFEVLGKNG